MKVFTTGTVVQVFLLAHGVPADTWTGDGLARGAPGQDASGDDQAKMNQEP